MAEMELMRFLMVVVGSAYAVIRLVKQRFRISSQYGGIPETYIYNNPAMC